MSGYAGLGGALIGGGMSILGSLAGKQSPKDQVAAARLLDEQDPIRRTLEAVGLGKCDLVLHMVGGHTFRTEQIDEIGYGAARVRVVLASRPMSPTGEEFPFHFNYCRDMVIRFAQVAAIEGDLNTKADHVEGQADDQCADEALGRKTDDGAQSFT